MNHRFKPETWKCEECGLNADAHEGGVWTKEKPTEDGWYWVRTSDGKAQIEEVVFACGLGFVNRLGRDYSENLDKQEDDLLWQGPLKPQE